MRNSMQQNFVQSERTGQLNLHRSPSQILREEEEGYLDENGSQNDWQVLDQDQDDDVNESITSEQFYKLIEAQGTESLKRLKSSQNDADFSQYAEQFLQELRKDMNAGPKNMRRLMDYINFLD